jgi:hypothetical protein
MAIWMTDELFRLLAIIGIENELNSNERWALKLKARPRVGCVMAGNAQLKLCDRKLL